jgi:leucyl/phenylalanyl-tRNA--protein transferase
LADPPEFDLQRPNSELLLTAYCQGIFPMAEPQTGRIHWYSPDPRAIIPLDAFHISNNLGRLLRQRRFEIRSDTAFEAVMRACAAPRPNHPDTWINDRLVRAYAALHQRGFAHSVEAWLDGQLVGGLYGVHIGGAFFGESMFIRPELGGTNASKVCMAHLVGWMRHRKMTLLDAQLPTDHTRRFGCVEIRRDLFQGLLDRAIRLPVRWGAFDPEVALQTLTEDPYAS